MATLVLRSDDDDLSFAEADANFDNLNTEKMVGKPVTSTGTNAITVSYDPTISSYTTNMVYTFKVGSTNTGATTLAIDGNAATAVQDLAGNALRGREFVAGHVAHVIYNGTNFRLINPYTFPPINISNHTVPYSTRYFYNGADEPQDNATNITTLTDANTIFSVGDSTSGADVAWADLDQVPTGARALLLTVGITVTTATSVTTAEFGFETRPNSSSAFLLHFEIEAVAIMQSIGGNGRVWFPCEIAIDPDTKTFDLSTTIWGVGIRTDYDTFQVDLNYRGYCI